MKSFDPPWKRHDPDDIVFDCSPISAQGRLSIVVVNVGVPVTAYTHKPR